MTLNTVSHLYQQAGIEAGRGRLMVGLDLKEVPSVDSSGLALLLEWQSESLKVGNSLQVRNAPPDLLSLVSLCEAGDLLAIKGRNQNGSVPEARSQTGRELN